MASEVIVHKQQKTIKTFLGLMALSSMMVLSACRYVSDVGDNATAPEDVFIESVGMLSQQADTVNDADVSSAAKPEEGGGAAATVLQQDADSAAIHGVTVSNKVVMAEVDEILQGTLLSTKSVVAPVDYRWYAGETLRQALERWTKQAGYQQLVWEMRDAEGDIIEIPIASDHQFGPDFKDNLKAVRKAYATSPIAPLFLRIDIKQGNKTIIVSNLLHNKIL